MEDIAENLIGMDYHICGIIYKLKQSKNIDEATKALELLGRKTKANGMSLKFKLAQLTEERDNLKKENEVLKEKIKESNQERSNAWKELAMTQNKVRRSSTENEELQRKLYVAEAECTSLSQKLETTEQAVVKMQASQDIFEGSFSDNNNEEQEEEQQPAKRQKTSENEESHMYRLDIYLGNKGAHIYNGNVFICDNCGKTYKQQTALAKHTCLLCKKCGKVVSSAQRLKSHVCTEGIVCTDCKKTYKSVITLKKHKCTYCHNCCQIFSTIQKLGTHKCTSKRHAKTTTILDSQENDVDAHETNKSNHSASETYKEQSALAKHTCLLCKKCGKVVSSAQRLKSHVCTEGIVCTDCKKTYKSVITLKKHKCTYCHNCCQIFSTFQKLGTHKCTSKRHAKTTTILDSQENDVDAHETNKSNHSASETYKEQSALAKHTRSCLLCKKCGAVVSSAQRLKSHVCTKGIVCTDCKKTYNSVITLKKHKCTYCHNCCKVFSTFQKLGTHKCTSKRHAKTTVLDSQENDVDAHEINKSNHSASDIKAATNSDNIQICTPLQSSVITQVEQTQLQFKPVRADWQRKTCSKLNLRGQVTFERNLISQKLEPPSKFQEVIGDGNCFFRCISYVVTGSEHKFHVFRMKLVQHMLQNANFCTHLLDNNVSVQEYMQNSRMAENKTWATQVEMFLMAHLLKTDIYVYTKISDTVYQWLKHSAKFLDRSISVNSQSIYLHHKNGNHYDVVLDVTNSQIPELYQKELIYKELQNQLLKAKQKQTQTHETNVSIKTTALGDSNQRVKDTLRKALKRKNETDIEKSSRLERDRLAKRKKRASSLERSTRNERDRGTQNERRQHSEHRARRNERDRGTQNERRQHSEHRARRNERDRGTQNERRQHSEHRATRNERERIGKKEKRRLSNDWEISVENFKSSIRNGPTYICTVCHRLLYQKSVKVFNLQENTQELQCHTGKLSHDGKEYICNSCQKAINSGQIPPFATVNGLQLDEIPQQIDELNSLEAVFISRRIPFMKILALPRGKQKAIHGCVVNVPIEPEQLVSVLPRVPTSESLITVKVKRKLMYRGHVFLQRIRPEKIKVALHILKHDMKNPLYDDVILNDNWMEDSCNNDNELWDSLTATSTSSETPASEGNDYANNQDDLDTENQLEEEIEDERTRLSGLPYDSCIQPKDIVAEQSHILNIAPGEGKKPTSFALDDHAEELSFPQLFPTGKFGYSHQRPQKLSLKKYFQSRILNCDGRFSKNIDYIFFAQYRTEAKEVNDSISISLRKATQQNVTAGQVKEKMSDIVRNDLGIHFLQKIRGSPAYFNKLFYDLLGMIRQLGPCTWFVTLSAADLKWPDTIRVIAQQQGTDLTDDEIQGLSWEEKCQILRSNPVTAARHFDQRVQLFFKHILMNRELNPLGEIVDYKYRIEFQHRGSPHVHMLAWAKNAPTLDTNTEEEIKGFIDGKLSCQLPHDDEDLETLLRLVQRHTHSVACRKHGKSCRFGFPRPPLNDTVVFKPPNHKPTAAMQEVYSAALTAVYEHLEDVNEKTTLKEILHRADVNEGLYMTALQWIMTKSGQPSILLERKPCEVNVNNYNKILMKGWEANLDVQFVTNVFSCVMYLASYISKPEKTLGDVLKAVSGASQHLGTRKTMKNVAHKFLTHREISAQEAVYRVLSLPLSCGSREVIFVPTDLPETRTRLFKPMALISSMDDDDPDVYQKGLLDRYSARPDTLQNMCLAEFSSNYRTKYSSYKKDEEGSEKNEENGFDNRTIKLKNDLGCMSKRATPAIIRSHQWSKKKNREEYFHAQLMLYYPWRNEINDLLDGTYMDSYETKFAVIQQNRQNYEHHTEELADVLEDIEENGIPDDNWVAVAPQTEQARAEEEIEGNHPEHGVHAAYDTETQNSARTDAGLIPHDFVITTEDVTHDDWKSMILSLNIRQYELHQFVVNWATTMLLSHTGQKPKPFQIFLTGGARVGKSFLVRTIVQTVKRLFARNNQVHDNHVLVCAPTGAAAYNIAGYTCHSAFQLRPRANKQDDYIPLSTEKLSTMKDALGDTKLIIIDEISMVSADMLLTIHRRLCDMMGCHEPFGGISVLAVGDLMQLPAVAQKPIYSPPSDEIAAIYGSLWTDLFKIMELTQIQRQKDDQQFASLLNRIRVGEHNNQDVEILKSRQISTTSKDYPTYSTHMFTYNKLKDCHNTSILKNIQQPHFTFKATDSKKDEQTEMIEPSSFDKDAGGLHTELTVAVGARVILIKNIDVSDGLVNSAAGVIVGFKPAWTEDQVPETFKPRYILVKFDDDRIGKKCRAASRGIITDQTATPIPTVEVPVYLSKRSSKVTRKRVQFPLTLAWGVTIHKEQGKTEDTAVVSCEGNFGKGQFYTAVSRTRDLSGLYFLGEVTANKIKVNNEALKEVNRMKKEATFKPILPVSYTKHPDAYFKLQSLNINSFNPHMQFFLKGNNISMHHIICFQETWLITRDSTPQLDNFTCLRTDNKNSAHGHRQGGLLMYIRQDLRLLKQYVFQDITLEYQLVLLTHTQDESVKILVMSLYNNPRRSVNALLPDLEKLLQRLPQNIPVFIVGDLNIDLRKSGKASKDFLFLTQYYGLLQLVRQPTHRRGGILDLLFTNKEYRDTVLDVVPTFYSDHLIVSLAIPYRSIIENRPNTCS